MAPVYDIIALLPKTVTGRKALICHRGRDKRFFVLSTHMFRAFGYNTKGSFFVTEARAGRYLPRINFQAFKAWKL